MRVSTHHIAGIDIFTADFHNLDHDSLTDAQLSDINTIKADKRRRERAMTYALVNHAAATCGLYASLRGSLLGHRDNGSPFLCTPEGEIPAPISISHCKSGACIALGAPGQHFGTDIEDVSDRRIRVADKFLNDREKNFISNDNLLRAWTIKEAVYKAADSEGLTLRDGIAIQSLDTVSGIATASADGKLYTAIS
ncbi:MAG: 4'-phosphopantetheinyl transferase superfamily protein, partial [Muribaculaceae bacterium]|nr:4'-phosphopantetheinyl transferase superfamily protein [Muribaculaceae bacterium]